MRRKRKFFTFVVVLALLGLVLQRCGDDTQRLEPEAAGVTLPQLFDPSATPTLTGIDLDKLRAASQQVDHNADCPPPVARGNSPSSVVVMRIDGPCIVTETVPLDDQTLEEFRAELSDDPSVLAVDYPSNAVADSYFRQGTPDPDIDRQWHLDVMSATELREGWPDGAEVFVAVLDTGVDRDHPDFQGRLTNGIGGISTDVPIDEAINDPLFDGGNDPHGHGTHVAGIIAANYGNGVAGVGIAPKATIVPVSAISTNEHPVWAYGLGYAITYAVSQGATVVNMSLSIVDGPDDPDGDGSGDEGTLAQKPNQLDEAAVRLAQLKDVVLVASAGNCGRWKFFRSDECPNRNTVQYPASYPGVVSVASLDSDLSRSSFSTANSSVDIAAPGGSVLSSTPGGGSTEHSGTSMAAPMVSAVAAHLRARFPEATATQVIDAMMDSAEHMGKEGRNDETGVGLIKPLAAIERLDEIVTSSECDANTIFQRAVAEVADDDRAEFAEASYSKIECDSGWAVVVLNAGNQPVVLQSDRNWTVRFWGSEVCANFESLDRGPQSLLSSVGIACDDDTATPQSAPSIPPTTQPIPDSDFCEVMISEQHRITSILFPDTGDEINSSEEWGQVFGALGETGPELQTYMSRLAAVAPPEISGEVTLLSNAINEDPWVIATAAFGFGPEGVALATANDYALAHCGRGI